MFSNKEIKILFIMSDLDRGGPEMRLLDFAKHFPVDVKIFICVTSEEVGLLKELQKYDTNITIIPIIRAYLEISKLFSICRYVKENRISVINSFELKGLLIAVFIKYCGNPGLRVVHHTVDLLHSFSVRQKGVLWILLKLVDAVICNSMQAKEILRRNYFPEAKIRVIYNGVDTELFRRSDYSQGEQLRIKYSVGKNEIIIGTVANFRKEKNYPFLIDGFKRLLELYPALRLLCVGGGTYLDDIKRTVKDNGLGKKVIFTGYTPDVASHIAIMDIFVLCSLKESFPNALIQAMSMEIPVVASSVGGCKEIVKNAENGLLFEPNDRAGFINAVSRLIEDKESVDTCIRNAKTKVDRHFSLHRMIESYRDFYRSFKQ